ncbi:hypothetical protein ABZX38_24050 [Streptomyces longwoodensis]|uniref:hypothetical protein n=1 Tax=Streptomyces longwoodensis TaxID=68231 RepID=UPI0033BF1D34
MGVPLVLMLHPREHYGLADLPDELAAELGVLSTHIGRHVQGLPHIARGHVYRVGDGAAHCGATRKPFGSNGLMSHPVMRASGSRRSPSAAATAWS